MDKIAYYKEQIEKTALNAMKAREMAKNVGLFPEGQWKWGLRKLRNMNTGKVLEGKELADAKKGIGMMNNNSYQQVKSMSRKLGGDTEIGGRISTYSGKLYGITKGDKGAGNVSLGMLNLSDPRNFHTHPSTGKYGLLNTAKKVSEKLVENKKRLGDDLSREYEIKALHQNKELASRFSGKRNPLAADMSGAIMATGGKNYSKQDLKHFKQNIKNLQNKLGKEIGNWDGKHYSDLTESQKNISDLLSRKITRAKLLKKESAGDYAVELYRKNNYQDWSHHDFKHNIISPESDIEAVHKVISPGRKRSVYFDKTPKKAR